MTEKVISTVGSLILTKGRGSTLAGSHRVLPMVTSGRPEKATMSPAVMLSQGNAAVGLEVIQFGSGGPSCGPTGSCQSQTTTSSPTRQVPF